MVPWDRWVHKLTRQLLSMRRGKVVKGVPEAGGCQVGDCLHRLQSCFHDLRPQKMVDHVGGQTCPQCPQASSEVVGSN